MLPMCSSFASKSDLQNAVNMWVNNEASALTTYGHISTWDTSRITDMSYLFHGKSSFNDNISAWNVSIVTTMRAMFNWAINFNQPLNAWDVSSVLDFQWTFAQAHSFNQPLHLWEVQQVTNFYFTFDNSGMSDCNKATTAHTFSASSAWPSYYSGWSSLCMPQPPLLPPPTSPPAPPTTFYIRGDRSQIVFGTNDECTLGLVSGATSLTSSCPINTPSSRRLEDASNISDHIAQLEERIAQLEMDKAEMKEQLQFLTTELKMLKEQHKAP